MATNYTYDTVTASNGVTLRYIKTSPNNVKPVYLDPAKYITASGYYGVNGGYFDTTTNTLLCIAVTDGEVINTTTNEGYSNNYSGIDRGTLVWDADSGEYSVQVVTNKSKLDVSSDNYWAQGGISMSLGDDAGWYAQATSENIQNATGSAYRTGVVYNTGLNIWFVVSTGTCTASAFRTAIKDVIGSGTLVDGIFLDGGSSTGLSCAGGSQNSSRAVPQMLALIETD